MEWWATALFGIMMLLGVVAQRTGGLGFAMVCSPALVALLGPLNGVAVINLFAVLTSATVIWPVRRNIEWRKAITMFIPAVCLVVPGAFLARSAPEGPLSIVIGVMIFIAMGLAPLGKHLKGIDGTGGLIVAGGMSGFMNVMAGTGGPPLTAYAVASSWRQDKFAATLQPYFVGVGTCSLLMRWQWPALSLLQWGIAVGAVVIGLIIGNALAHRIPSTIVRRFVVVLALVGATIVVIKGVLMVLA